MRKSVKSPAQLLPVIESLEKPKGMVEALREVDEETADRVAGLLEAARRDISHIRADVVFVGSFSSGKSTLVNKLVGEEVVPSGRGVVTARPVWIRPGANRQVGWWKDGEFQPERLPTKGSIAEWILDRQEKPPAKVRRPWIGVDLERWPFDPGVRILDTPGFNSEFPEHSQRTVEALSEAEIAVVVVEPRGLAEDAREFVQSHVAGRVPVVAVVLNQLDLVDSEEIPELLEHARQHAEGMGLPDATIIGCSARGAADSRGHYRGWDGVRQLLGDLAGERVHYIVAQKVSQGLKAELASVKERMEAEREQLATTRRIIKQELGENDSEGLYARMDEKYEKAQTRLNKKTEATGDALTVAKQALIDGVEGWMEDDDNDPTEEADVKKALKRLFGDYVDRSQKEIFEYRSEASEVVTRLDREIHAAVQKSWSKVAAECPSTVFRQSDGEVKVGAGAAAVSFSVGDLPSSFGTAAGATAIGAAIGSVIPGVGTLVGAGLGLLWSAIFGNAREEACEKIVEVVNEQIEKLDLSIDQAWEVQIDAANQGVVDVFNTRWEAYSSAMELLDQELEKRQAEAERRQRLVAKVLKESNRVARELSATG